MRFPFQTVLTLTLLVAMPAWGLAQSRSSRPKEPDWIPFESELMNYKTLFPGKPKEVTKKPNSRAGDLIVNTVSHESKDVVYAITATMYPEKFKDADPKKLVGSAFDALSANGGKIIASEPFEATGANEKKYPGKDITVEFGKTRIRTRLVLVNLVLYQVSVTGTEKALANQTTGKFLSAFEVTK